MLYRLKYLSATLLILMMLSSCDSKERTKLGDDNRSAEYLGTWKRIPREGRPATANAKVVTFTVSQSDGGFFMKYNNGTTYPLKYESEGRYYYAVTPMGNVPLLFDQGVITINNGFEFKYGKVGEP
jgi:hypothetical protein